MNIVDTATSAFQLINNSHQKANQAAQQIATLPIDPNEVGASTEFNSKSLLSPVLQLKEAELENQAGVKVLQADDEMKQSLIDLFV